MSYFDKWQAQQTPQAQPQQRTGGTYFDRFMAEQAKIAPGTIIQNVSPYESLADLHNNSQKNWYERQLEELKKAEEAARTTPGQRLGAYQDRKRKLDAMENERIASFNPTIKKPASGYLTGANATAASPYAASKGKHSIQMGDKWQPEYDKILREQNLYKRGIGEYSYVEDSYNRYRSDPAFKKFLNAKPEATEGDFLGRYLSMDEGERNLARGSVDYGPYNPYSANKMAEKAHHGSWDYIHNDEIALYYTIQQKEGQAAANKYLEDMKVILNRRQAEAERTAQEKKVEEANWLEHAGMAIATTPASIVGGSAQFIEDTISGFKGEDINPYAVSGSGRRYSGTVRGKQSQMIDDATGGKTFLGISAGDVYQAGMSTLDMVAGSYLGPGFYEATMGMGAAADEATKLYEEGASREQIQAGAGLAGAAEVVFEHLSLENLIHLKDARSIRQAIMNTLVQGGVEGSEEAFTEIANILTNALVMRDQSDYQKLVDAHGGDEKAAWIDEAMAVWKATAGGFLAGAPAGGIKTAADYVGYKGNVRETGKQIREEQGATDKLLKTAEEMTAGKDDKTAKYVTKKMEAVQEATKGKAKDKAISKAVGELQDAVNVATKQNTITDLKTALQEQGFSKPYAKHKAADVAEFLYGNPTPQQAMTAMKFLSSDSTAVVAARKQAFKEKSDTGAYTIKPEDVKVSETGEAQANGKAIETNKIINDEGKLAVQTEDGPVPFEEVEWATEDEAVEHEAISRVTDDPQIAMDLASMAKESKMSGADIAAGIQQAAYMGSRNMPKGDLSRGEFSRFLKPEMAQKAYEAGQKAEAAKPAEAGTKRTNKVGSVEVRRVKGGPKLTSIQETSLKNLNQIAKLTGIQFGVFESYIDSKGRRVFTDPLTGQVERAPNGIFDPDTGRIWIDLNAGQNGEGTLLFTAGHELTHLIRKTSPSQFKALSDIIMQEYSKQGKSVDQMIRQQQLKALADKRTLTYDAAYEEFIADSLQGILADGNVTKFMADVKAKDLGLWGTIKKWFKDFAASLKKVADQYRGLKPDTAEGRFVQEVDGLLERLEPIFAEGLIQEEVSRTETSKSVENAAQKQETATQTDEKAAETAEIKEAPKAEEAPKTKTAPKVKEAPATTKESLQVEEAPKVKEALKPVEAKTAQMLEDRKMLDEAQAQQAEKAQQQAKSIVDSTPQKAKFSGREKTPLAIATDEMVRAQLELQRVEQEYRKVSKSEEYLKAVDDVVKAGGTDEALEKYKEVDSRLKVSELSTQKEELQKKFDAARKRYNQEYEASAKGKEAKAIEKSGLPAAEYFRKKAQKEFGYTTDFREAGYLLPNGKMLNFSGEKGEHWGYRQRDHREIGPIYANEQGTKAMVRFMNDGNIRVMAETPGLDISNSVPLTPEQYTAVRKMVKSADDFFAIDFSDETGHNIGSYSYQGKLNADRVVNDIKYFFENGKTREDSGISQFLYSARDTDYASAVKSGNMEQAQKMVDQAAKAAGYRYKGFHGSPDFGFTVFNPYKSDDMRSLFFTDSPEVASTYTYEGKAETQRIRDKGKEGGSNIYGTYLRINNPLIVNAKGGDWNNIEFKTKQTEEHERLDDKIYELSRKQDAYDRKYEKEYINSDKYQYPWELPSRNDVFPGYDALEEEIDRLYEEQDNIPSKFVYPGGMKTRDISEYAKAEGYDGVIIENVHDHGGKSNDNINPASTVYVVFNSNQVKSADPVTYDDSGKVIPLSERFKDTEKDIRYSLRPVDPVQPTSGKWKRTIDTEEAKSRFPNLWDVAADESEARNPTQISSTVKSYRKIYNYLKAEGFTGKILDASSGLGFGTKAGIEEYGFDVDDIEPYPDKSYSPKYRDYSALHKKYDVIISNAVLNVLPQDQRDALVVKMGELLNDGGRIFINTRSKDVDTLGSNASNVNISPMEWYVSSTGSYQKGFIKKELEAYIQDALGPGFTVEPTSLFGAASVIVTKKANGVLYSTRDRNLEQKNKTLQKQNERLKGDISNLKELVRAQGKLSHGKLFKQSSVEAVARKLMKDSNVTGDRAELVGLLNDLYSYIAQGDEITWEQVKERADKAAEWLMEHQKDPLTNEAQEILRELKGKRIKIDSQQAQEIKHRFGSVKELRRILAGTVILDQKNGTDLDSMWQNWAAEYGYVFDSDMNSVDMPGALADIVDAMRDDRQSNHRDYDPAYELQDLSQKVYEGYWDIATLLTVADKKQVEIDALKGKLRETSTESKATIKKLRKDHKEVMKLADKAYRDERNAIQKENRTTIRNLEKAHRQEVRDKAAEVAKRYQEARSKNVEGRKKTALRHKIQKVVDRLNGLLTHGTKEKHIPRNLIMPVRDALDLINMEVATPEERKRRFDSHVASYERQIAAEKNPEEKARLQANMEAYIAAGDKFKANVDALKAAYAEIAESKDPVIINGYDQGIAERISIVSELVGNTRLADMSVEQLTAVYDMYRAVAKTISNANKAHNEAIKENISTLGDSVIRELRATGGVSEGTIEAFSGIQKYFWQELKPVQFFQILGSDTMNKLFQAVRSGEDKFAVDIAEAQKFHAEQARKYGANKWDNDKLYTFKSSNGKDLKLNLQQMLSIYAYVKRGKTAKDHFREGGVVMGKDTKWKKKIFGINFDFRPNASQNYQLGETELGEIISKLTDNQKAYADAMQEYLSKNMAEKGNEVSRELYDLDLFGEENYFPLKSASEWMARAAASEQQKNEGFQKIKNKGMTKETTPGAGNPVVLSGFDQTWGSHVDEMSVYHSMVLPLEDFNRVFAYRSDYDIDAAGTVQSAITDAYGNEPLNYINQLIRQLNGGVRADPNASILNKAISRFKKGAVLGSASVWAQQYSAVLRSMAVIDPKYFLGISNLKDHNKLWDEIKHYAPVAIIKEMGGFDTSTGATTVDYLLAKERTGADKVKDFFSKDGSYRDETIGWMPGFMDEVGWITIWRASNNQAKAEMPDATAEAIKRRAGEIFTKAVTETQVYDSVLSRSGLMRSKDTGWVAATAFMAEPTTITNMVANAIVQQRRGQKGAVKRTLASILLSSVANAAFAAVIYAARDDDDDESYWEKYIASFFGEVLEGLNPASYLPIFKDILSLLQGWDVERADLSVWADLIKSAKKLTSDKVTTWRKVEDFGGSIAKLFGIPLKNLMRDMRSIYNVVEGWGRKTSLPGIGYALRSGLPGFLGGRETSKPERMYDAYLRNDTEAYNELAKTYAVDAGSTEKGNKKVRSEMRDQIKEHYKDGKLTRAEASNLLMEFAEESQKKNIYWTIDSWDHEGEEGWRKYSALEMAIDSGDNLDKEIQRYLENGLSDTEIISEISGTYKERYIDADPAGKREIIRDLTPAFEQLGLDEDDIEEKFKYWDFEASHGYSFDKLREQYLAGNIDDAAVASAMEEMGYDQDAIDDRIADYGFEARHKFKYSELKDKILSGDVTYEQAAEYMAEMGKKPDGIDDSLQEIRFEDDYGYPYSDVSDRYKAGDLDHDEVFEILTTYGDMTYPDAENLITAYDWERELGIDVPMSAVESYYKYQGHNLVTPEEYMVGYDLKSHIHGDYDKVTGEYIKGSKEQKVIEAIGNLDISDEEKENLALSLFEAQFVYRYRTW